MDTIAKVIAEHGSPEEAAAAVVNYIRAHNDELAVLLGYREDVSGCTGIAASWCPVHGDCTCPDINDETLDDVTEDSHCPLHAASSNHAEEL